MTGTDGASVVVQRVDVQPARLVLLTGSRLATASLTGAMLRHALLGKVWGGDYTDQTEYLRVFVRHLRKKIELDPAKPRYILTEPWIGYRFNPE